MLRRLAPIALLAIACKPASADTPEPAAPESAAPMASAQAEPELDAAEPAPAEEPELDAVAPEPEPDAPQPEAAEPEPESETEPETEKPAKPEKDEVAQLPKPLFKSVNDSCGRDKGVGTKLKPFRLKNLEGKEITNGRFRKRVMLVNFWGSWCAPCLKELPEFSRLYRRYRKHGMTLVAIATDEEPEPVKELLAKRKIRAKVLLGGEKYAGSYGAPNFPFTYVVDTSGTIVGSYHGYKEECMGKLEDDIRNALEER